MAFTTTKKKLCWNCEGNVSKDAINCPFCGVYLRRDEDLDNDYEDEEEDPLTPPYKMINPIETQAAVPQPPYPASEVIEQPPLSENSKKWNAPIGKLTEWKAVFVPILFLLSGSVFLIFGMILSLFSKGGILTLQWQGSLWIWYFVLAFPLLYFGWRTLKNLDEDINAPSS